MKRITRKDARLELVRKVSAMTPEQRKLLALRFGAVNIDGHIYSDFNQCLIASQSADASILAGYKQWQSIGRQVREGEHGISIVIVAESSDDSRKYRFCQTIFDISQTILVEEAI